ncbi:hypothetical protein BGX30_009153 [Mortierella sp. GBA39]|nr:hypothetical protein BGX30_009153 [Mortierella sp. GBA39]
MSLRTTSSFVAASTPRAFRIRRSTWPRCLTTTLLKKHARTSENNCEDSRAWKRKKRRAEKAAVKGHESQCRVDTKSGTEAITDANADADADASTKDHNTRTRSQGETRKTARTATLGAQAYRRYVAKETIKERERAFLLAQVQAQIEKERRDLHAAPLDLFGSDFCDDRRGGQDGNCN